MFDKFEPYLQKLQKSWFGHAGLFNKSHGVCKVVHIITVHIQHHGFRKLQENTHNITWLHSDPLSHILLTQFFTAF